MPDQEHPPKDHQLEAAETPQFREMPPDVQKILDAHQQWVKTGGKEGQKADLRNADLQGLDLSGVNLEGANLTDARLIGANLTDANLQQADLSGASFKEADLRRTQFQDAKLEDANLENAENLLASQLARTDLTNAKLPEDVAKFPELDNLTEASKSCRNQLFTVLLGCAYTWLTVLYTTDAGLLTNAAVSKLPFIGTSIKIVPFYFVAPILLLAFYVYFHFNLQNLYEGLADLPAIFPDGRRLDQHAYPWLLNKLVCLNFPKLKMKNRRPPRARQQVFLSIILAWGLIPLTLLLIWVRYLTAMNPATLLHIVLLSFSLMFGLRSYTLTEAMLRGGRLDDIKQSLSFLVGAVSSLIFLFLFAGLFFYDTSTIRNKKNMGSLGWSPYVFSLIGYSPYANLVEVDVSTKPANWTGEENQIPLVKGAELKNRNLSFAQAKGAFFVKADLRFVNLQGAKLQRADIRVANLLAADLQEANLQGANLQGSLLQWANLRGANLKCSNLKWVTLKSGFLNAANLQGANLEEAKLSGADLYYADLQGANLERTNLHGADLRRVKGLTKCQVTKALSWPLAYYDIETLKNLGLPPDHNQRIKEKNMSKYNLQGADLKGPDLQGVNLKYAKLNGAALQGTDLGLADLQGADLQGADLKEADLRGAKLKYAKFNGANLQGANLQGADLRGTDLRGAKGLTQKQLEKAKIDENTKLPDYLKKGTKGKATTD